MIRIRPASLSLPKFEDKEVMQSLFASLDLVDLTFKARGKMTVRYPKEEGSKVEVWRMLMACRDVAGLHESIEISIERM